MDNWLFFFFFFFLFVCLFVCLFCLFCFVFWNRETEKNKYASEPLMLNYVILKLFGKDDSLKSLMGIKKLILISVMQRFLSTALVISSTKWFFTSFLISFKKYFSDICLSKIIDQNHIERIILGNQFWCAPKCSFLNKVWCQVFLLSNASPSVQF